MTYDSSEHKSLSVRHHGHRITISYWIDYSKDRKIVQWGIKRIQEDRISDKTIKSDQYIREPLGGRSGILGIGARPERSFHEMIAEAIENGVRCVNEKLGRNVPPEPDEIATTLEIRGYEVDHDAE